MLSREFLHPPAQSHGQPRSWGPGTLWNANEDPVPVSWLDELSLTLQLKCHFYQEAPRHLPDEPPPPCALTAAPAALLPTRCIPAMIY